jgi:hypothetical protein
MALASEMRRLTGTFAGDFDNRKAFMDNFQVEMSAKMSDIAENRKENTARVQAGLADFIFTFHERMTEMMDGLEAAHSDMSREVDQKLKDLGEAREEMGAEQRERLTDEHKKLEADVKAAREDLQADQAEAQKIWADFNGKMDQRRAGKPARTAAAPTAESAPSYKSSSRSRSKSKSKSKK